MFPHYVYDWSSGVARYRNILGGPALTLEEMILDAIGRHAASVQLGSQIVSVESLVKNYSN
jgi:hypothetical protein